MRSGWILISLACLLAACGGATPTSDFSSPLPTVSARPTVAPTDVTSATSPSPTSTAPTPTRSALMEFRILSPEDEAVVNVPEVEVVGEAEPETVITLNEEIVVVDESGTFSVTLPLDEGPNEIEIVASDLEGNELSLILEVTYDPES
jgi:hypothetical protein